MEEMCQKAVIAQNFTPIGLIGPECLRKSGKICRKSRRDQRKNVTFCDFGGLSYRYDCCEEIYRKIITARSFALT